MRLFYGTFRRLSTVPILLFLVGWCFYLVGFLKRMIKPTPLFPRWDNYPSIIAAGVGPVFVLSALLQSCLGGTAGAAAGSVAAAASVVFLVSVGNSSLTAAQTLYQYNSSLNHTEEELSLLYTSTTLVGSVFCCLGVTFLLCLWGCYQDPPKEQVLYTATGGYNDDDDGQSGSKWFPGWARKLAVPCITIAFIGWGVLVGGHYHRINSQPEEGRYVDDILTFDFGQWGACVLVPLLLIFGLMHAGTSSSASVAMGVVNTILSGVALVSLGYDMVHDVGGWLKRECETKCNYTLPRNAAALCELIGSFLVCFFWGSTLAMWPFYRKQGKEEQADIGMEMPSRRRRANSRDYMDDEEPLKV